MYWEQESPDVVVSRRNLHVSEDILHFQFQCVPKQKVQGVQAKHGGQLKEYVRGMSEMP